MKTVFIINPAAGQGKNVQNIINKINAVDSEAVDVYITQAEGDATRYVKRYCEDNGSARFIACGGDGTLNEVFNGTIEYPDCEIGVMPMGTGNDFCRNFPNRDSFMDIDKQITSATQKCDAIKYIAKTSSGEKSGYCVNMVNIGFDCNVAVMTAEMKKKPMISGSMAYFLSILGTLIKKKGADLKIELDGEIMHKGALLLTSIANGSYCGGGIMSNPMASVQDGLINVNIINDIPRVRFITLLPHYMRGTHMGLKNIEKVISSIKGKKLAVTPRNGEMKMSIDGEIITVGETVFEIIPKAFNFVTPK